MKKRLQRTAGLLLSVACICCAGCGRRNMDDLDTLRLEQSRSGTETGDVVQDDSRFSGTFGSTEKTGDSNKNKNENSNSQESDTAGTEQTENDGIQQIFVYVCGAVKTPGVYELKAGARIYEAIACAGGVREDAAEESVNQAQAVSDGERLYIPTDEEVREGMEAYLQPGIAGGSAGGTEPAGRADSAAADGNADGKVNINTASMEELKTLNGIGDTRAGSILAYREANGPFGSIEDLMQVEGIKEGVYNKLKDDITVN